MNTERVVGRHRSQSEVEELLRDYAASDLRRREFCLSRGIGVSTLSHHLKRSRQASAGAHPQFVAVELCCAKPALQHVVAGQVAPLRDPAEGSSWADRARSSGLAVVLTGDRRIEVQHGFDAGVLEQLVRALERA
jgi:hypothetical protein